MVPALGNDAPIAIHVLLVASDWSAAEWREGASHPDYKMSAQAIGGSTLLTWDTTQSDPRAHGSVLLAGVPVEAAKAALGDLLIA